MNEQNKSGLVTRRDFGKVVLGAVPALGIATGLGGSTLSALGQMAAMAKPNSLINGVQIGTITYSFRSMPDQSAEATLRYCQESGINAIELMAGPIQNYLGMPSRGGGGGGGRAAAGGAAGAAGAPAGPGGAPGRGGRGPVDPATLTSSWNGVACAPSREGGGGRAAAAPAAALTAAAGAQPNAAAPAGGRAGRGGPQTPEQEAAAAQYAADLKKWRESVSTDKIKALRKLFNDAGVTIYATKTISTNMSDEELDFHFAIAQGLGATHTTLELTEDEAALKRLGDFGLKKKIFVAYHTHAQGTITVFDKAFAASKGNYANVDFGHYVAGGGGNPVLFLEKFHDRISSFHLKDRTTPDHCALNLPWGTGETPIKEILQTVKKNKWKMPASIELEYSVPEGSDAVKEVRKCLQYCKDALA
ncbi:MAG: sugar phosphate isomerase/epimerase [Acidobacteriota bacterium]